MLNFTVGPVMMESDICSIGCEQIPYFRTTEFSELMLENEKNILSLFNAKENSKVIFFTGSGTLSMEAAICNCFDEKDHVLIINGGSFGQRFVELCKKHSVKYDEIKLEYGDALSESDLEQYDGVDKYTGFLVNMHETSTGVLYDMKLIGNFCKRNNLFLVVDCISSFIADEFHMESVGANIAITGSQKALGLPPGVSITVLDDVAIERTLEKKCKCLYFDYSVYLENMKRGQTPFTPAVSILIQLNKRLKMLQYNGLEYERSKIKLIAEDFRKRIINFDDFKFLSKNPSNALTALIVSESVSAKRICDIMKDEYQIFICPNGGNLSDKVFRVGHIGNISINDNDTLFCALNDIQRRGIL